MLRAVLDLRIITILMTATCVVGILIDCKSTFVTLVSEYWHVKSVERPIACFMR